MALSGETPVESPPEAPIEAPFEVPVKRRRSAWIYLGLVVIVILFVGGIWFFKFNTSMPVLTIYPSQGLTSSDWSGYTVSADLLSPKAAVTSVTGSWTIPTVTASPSNSFSAAWIGVGGQYDQALIQTGTEHDWVNGSPSYAAWYELLPQDSVQLSMTISPGDVMTASITLQDAATQTWAIQITDTTKGQIFKQNFNYPTTRLSAEWIIERPVTNNRISTFASFSRVTFTGCSATLNGRTGSITDFPHSSFSLIGRMNNYLDAVSSPTNGGSSFNVDFIAAR